MNNRLIKVQNINIRIKNISDDDYICLTDIAKGKENNSRSADIIKNWIRNRSTLDFLGTWEKLYNSSFKVVEFDHFKTQAGLHSFTMSVNDWVNKTNSIGIKSIAGKYGGTFAHKDIAFEFCSSINPVFKLYIIKEYQRLKELENNQSNTEWNFKRILSKANYHIHTKAIKDYIIPNIPKNNSKKENIIYATEADLLNLALFGCTAKEFRDNNKRIKEGVNIRDFASINELLILANLENFNAYLIKEGIDKNKRFEILKNKANEEKEILNNKNYSKNIINDLNNNDLNNSVYKQKDELSTDEKLKTSLDYQDTNKLK